ncbi:SusC/RagA family TonB-linked outer membrane protein [Flavobacterium luteum]|uniref:TonB-dependent receptor n=1 Tax=Flavobacterium luteum TaxID=2026654 RepID=A0A7J5A910_9FLAO|nr:TonB-dependent receptor [Flavobacterium luteum]KAB1154015.1 TonB-dependent receptor [Flavobacterium luteum]
MKFKLLTIIFFTFSISLFAQGTIEGVVKDLKGLPIPQTNVTIKGTKNGVITDFDGIFKIKAKIGDVLTITCTGFTKKEVKIQGSSIEIVLVESNVTLDEVVVIGYGTAKKKDLTGAISSVRASSIEKGDPLDVQTALAGRVAGLQITQNDNGLGSGVKAIIRGGSSLTSGNQPLYVIDGFPIIPDENVSSNPLSDLDPGQIKSIEVLKDASATAIYGARGSNGVIIITTKLGKEGKAEISATLSTGLSLATNFPRVLTPSEFIDQRIRYDQIDYLNGTTTSINPYWQDKKDANTQGTNWAKAATQAAVTRKLDLSMGGGSKDGLQYQLSGSYLDQEGVVIATNFKRYNLNSNIVQTIGQGTRIGTNIKLAFTKNIGRSLDKSPEGIFKKVFTTNPFQPIDFTLGQIDIDPEINTGNNENVLTYLNQVKNQTESSRIIGNVFYETKVTKDLTFYTSYGFNRSFNNSQVFYPSTVIKGRFANGVAQFQKGETLNQVVEARLNYKKVLGLHNINATAVGEFSDNQRSNFTAGASNFSDQTNGFNDLTSAILADFPTNVLSEEKLASYLGRVSYGYNKKYLLTASMRADGSSKFGKDNKWGYFPSLALGWTLSEESFIKNTDIFDNLKLRASYGLTGNNQIPAYSALSLLNAGNYVFNDIFSSGKVPNNVANPDLKWETTAQYNLGLDLGFFNNRLTVTAEVYYKKTTDLLLDVQLPPSSGFETALKNIGSFSNKGFELTVNSVNINNSDFKWRSDFTFSLNRSMVLDLGDKPEFYFDANISGKFNNEILVRVGESTGLYYGYIEDQIINNQTEAANSPKQLGAGIPDFNNNGQVKIYDVNGDGLITLADKVPIANTTPEFIGGLNNEFTYKSFDFSFFLRFSYGNDVINANVTDLDKVNIGNNNTLLAMYNHSYSGAFNPTGTFHGENGNGAYSTLFRSSYVEDGSFIKCDYITLGYAMPKSVVESLNVSKFRLFARVNNPFMLTRYSWFDPEVNAIGGTAGKVGGGVDLGSYPRNFTVTCGLSLNF